MTIERAHESRTRASLQWWSGAVVMRVAAVGLAGGLFAVLWLDGLLASAAGGLAVALGIAALIWWGMALQRWASWRVRGGEVRQGRAAIVALSLVDAALLAGGAVLLTAGGGMLATYPGAPVARSLALWGLCLCALHVRTWLQGSRPHLFASLVVLTASVVAWLVADAATPPSWRLEQAVQVILTWASLAVVVTAAVILRRRLAGQRPGE